MYLSRLFIQNFRSIKELDLAFKPGKNVIVGRNNAGKSNIVRALDLVLGESSPTYHKADNITANDFFCWKETVDEQEIIKSANDIFIWCELTREQNEDLNYDEMYKTFGMFIYSSLVERGYPRVYAPIRLDRNEMPSADVIFEIDEDEHQEKEYVNPKLRNQGELEKHFESKYSFAFAFRATRNEEGEIYKEIRFLYRETEAQNWIMSFRAPYRNEFLLSAIIPSFRDPFTQLRLAHWSWYGKLVRHLTLGYQDDPDLKQAIEQVAGVAGKIFSQVNLDLAQSTLQIAFPGTTVDFQFNSEKSDDLYKSTVIYVDDGFKSQLVEKGSGIQSATIISLFNYYIKHLNMLTSALLCIEEPELYLHPHARRVMSDRLDEFLDGNKNQVVLTTHSSEFLRTSMENLNLILVRKTPNGSTSKAIDIAQFRNILVDSNQNELFFSDKVIVCENLDAYVLRLISSYEFPGALDAMNVSVISAGGKDQIPVIARLLSEVGIPAYILADFDFLLRDQDHEKRKIYNAKPHASLESLGVNFFSQEHLFGIRGPKVFAELQRLRASIKVGHEREFYTAKTVKEVPLDLSEFLADLRNNGIGILDGQLEDMSKDDDILSSSKKLNLERIIALTGMAQAAGNISHILDVEVPKVLLQAVLK